MFLLNIFVACPPRMSPPTPASDIWSVGSTVVEMVTKNPPYADLPQVSAMYQSLGGTPKGLDPAWIV